MRVSKRVPLGVLFLALGVLSVAGPAAAQSVDTFHLRLYQDGAELAAAGHHGEAVAKLRLACFGMLDQPKILGPCLGRLLATQDAAEVANDEIEATVDRLLEVEKRFRGWSEPDPRFAPPADLRRRVEALFARHGTEESLARIPGLGDVALAKKAERIARLPLDERRRELNLLVQREAQVPTWHVMSAELALEEGDPRAAAAAAREILQVFEGHAGARCVLGRARAAQEQCDAQVIESLGMCPDDPARRSDVDQALLRCLVAAKRWTEADEVWRRLSQELRDQRPVRRLRRLIEDGLEAAQKGGAASAALEEEPPPETSGELPPGAAPTAPRESASTTPVYAPPPGIEEEDLLAARAFAAQPPVARPPVARPPAARPTAAQQEVAIETASSSADFGDLPGEARETLRRVRDALASEQRHLYAGLWTPVRKVAKRHDESAAAQRLAGSLAFRLGQWRDAVRFLRRDESLASTRPGLQLELAVALHYRGEAEAAREAFDSCRGLLPSSAWVEYWAAELNS